MKITKIMLLLLVLLCTSNVWAQLSEKEQQNFTLENGIIKDMKIYVSNDYRIRWKTIMHRL